MRTWLGIREKGFGVFLFAAAALCTMVLGSVNPASAINTELGGKPFTFTGVIKQGVGYGISGDQYDTKEGFQSFLTQIVLEGKYEPSPWTSLFLSGKYNADQAYPVFSSDTKWREKGFNKSRNHLGVLDDWQDILGEAHVTYKKEDFYLRVGKQLVRWGETDGFRLMDQLNPVDNRRGITDVEYENTIIPTWLVRAEYRVPMESHWMQDLNFQFIFNPNPKFRGNENIVAGNERMGIWAPMVDVSMGGAYPFDYAHLGEYVYDIEKPKDFSPEGFGYAGRVTANIWDARLSLNGYYGRSLDYVSRATGSALMSTSDYDGRMILSPMYEGYYPYFKFVGATFTRDLSSLRSDALGGVSPVLRFETFYAFNSTFVNSASEYVKHDEFRGATGMDWKVKIPLLNERAYFSISPQIYLQKIMNYPSERYGLSGSSLYENNWVTTLMVSTSYFHTKLQPSFFWYKDWTNKSEFYRYQLVWEHSSAWKYTLGALVVDGTKEAIGYEPIKHKDHVYFNMAYKF